jgi:hypothetical protein
LRAVPQQTLEVLVLEEHQVATMVAMVMFTLVDLVDLVDLVELVK